MIPAECLSEPELVGLTGYVQRSAQRRWLDMARVPYLTRRDGMPIVRRDSVQPAASSVKLNLGALRGRRQAA